MHSRGYIHRSAFNKTAFTIQPAQRSMKRRSPSGRPTRPAVRRSAKRCSAFCKTAFSKTAFSKTRSHGIKYTPRLSNWLTPRCRIPTILEAPSDRSPRKRTFVTDHRRPLSRGRLQSHAVRDCPVSEVLCNDLLNKKGPGKRSATKGDTRRANYRGGADAH